MFAHVAVRLGSQHDVFQIAEGERVLVGRCPSARVRLGSWEVSRRHALLSLEGEKFYVKDLSSGGTWIGEVPLEPNVMVPVTIGATLAIGPYRLEFALHPVPDTQRTAPFRQPPIPDGYSVVDYLGSGSSGEVWVGRSKRESKLVALKALHNAHPPGTDGHSRFLREATLYTKVDSPYVTRLHEFFPEAEPPLMVLELASGPTALDRLHCGPLSFREAARIGSDVARGVSALWEAGIVHRDVKPANIVLSGEGVAMLTDLGLARAVVDPAMTPPETGMGSLPYLAPEQLSNASEVDFRCDLYALGATLHHLLSGRRPFEGDTRSLLHLDERVRTEELTRMNVLRPDCPQELSDLVVRLLSKDPGQRPDSSQAVAEEFQAIASRAALG